jgi:uncharacterized protein with HXXEE motif
MDRLQLTFPALSVAQAAHPLEEYRGRLYDVFPPARFVSGAITSDRERGFLAVNALILAFGLWCWLWPLRRRWRIAIAVAWVWAVVEALNGIGHSAWSLLRGGYTPGVATAPALLVLALALASQLVTPARPNASACRERSQREGQGHNGR